MRVMNAKRWSAWMGVTALVTVAGCAVVLGIMGPHPVQAQTPTEPPQVLSARYLLPPDVLAGPRFRVDDRVPTDGYMGHYTLRSEVGTFTAVSRDLLKIRIAELAAIEQLEATSKTDVFLSGAAGAALSRNLPYHNEKITYFRGQSLWVEIVVSACSTW
jgi:hypothetical protein